MDRQAASLFQHITKKTLNVSNSKEFWGHILETF